MNYKKIQALVKHQFEWEKNFFFFTILATLITKLIFLKFNVHPFLVTFGIIGTALATLCFMRPEFTGRDRGFSAKYLTSFPVSRKELIIASTVIYIFIAIPFIVWLICFNSFVAPLIPLVENKATSTFNLICFLVLAGASSLHKLFFKARGVQWKPKFSEMALWLTGLFSIFIFLTSGTIALGVFVERQYSLNLGKYVTAFFDGIPFFVESPWLGVAILSYAWYAFHIAPKVSAQEIKSYKVPWSLKKDLFRIGGFGSATFACLVLTFSAIPKVFEGDMQAAVYDRDYKEIEQLISVGVDINKPNVYGATPMMVAIEAGDLKLVEFMETKGATYNGEVTKSNYKYNGFDARMFAVFSGNLKLVEFIKDKVPSLTNSNPSKTFSPIHVAAMTCDAKMVDYLIANGVNIEIKNSKGNTPLVLAAQKNCFESVVSFKEAGARFDIVDPSGKLALQDLGKRASPELKFFVEKNMRAPASK